MFYPNKKESTFPMDILSSREIPVTYLNKNTFSNFGDIIWPDPQKMRLINNGTTKRYHDLTRIKASGTDPHILVNIFRGNAFSLPIKIQMMERHPYGSQAFYPIENNHFLVVVAEDKSGAPCIPHAFLVKRGIGINYYPNTWHHPLLALNNATNFLVIDRMGKENNLEEYFYQKSWIISSLPTLQG